MNVGLKCLCWDKTTIQITFPSTDRLQPKLQFHCPGKAFPASLWLLSLFCFVFSFTFDIPAEQKTTWRSGSLHSQERVTNVRRAKLTCKSGDKLPAATRLQRTASFMQLTFRASRRRRNSTVTASCKRDEAQRKAEEQQVSKASPQTG